MADGNLLQGKKRARLTVVALGITILCGLATLFGNLRGVILYPSNLEARIDAADKRARSAANDVEVMNAANAQRFGGHDTRLKVLEDYRAELKTAIELLVYRANEMKVSLERMDQKLDRRDRERRTATDNPPRGE